MQEPEYLQERFAGLDDGLERREDGALPHSADAERVVLGTAQFSVAAMLQAFELLEPEHFYVPSHQHIFRAMLALFERGEEINAVLIGLELDRHGLKQRCGGVAYIISLGHGLPHANDISNFANVIIGKAKVRQLYKAAKKIAAEVLTEEELPDVVLGHAESLIYSLTETRHKTQLRRITPILDRVIERAEQNAGSGVALNGLSTGLIDIDKITSGLQKADLIILAGRPGTGKTSLAVSIINNVTILGGKRVAFFSLEMSEDPVGTRILCAEARVDFQKFQRGFLNHDDWAAIDQAYSRLVDAQIYLDEKPGISMLEMRAKVHRMILHGEEPDLIVVDYLQLMTGTNEHRKESRQQEVSGISRALKALAKELNVPLLALGQLNRAAEQRADGRPQLSDLRESGGIEQDADVVAFLYRDKKKQFQDDIPAEEQNIVEFIVAKQRNGPTGIEFLRYDAPCMRFDNLHHGAA